MSSRISPPSNQSQLVLFLHPQCPCSRATIRELEVIMAKARDSLKTTVFFIQPKDVSDSWVESDLWRSAQRIPGVEVHRDPVGAEAQLFGATTSGQALVYSNRALAYSGGITGARGHEGINTGRRAVLAVASSQSPESSKAPVFGCSLFSDGSEPTTLVDRWMTN